MHSQSRTRDTSRADSPFWHVEPLPTDHPFRTLGNVLATPHLGYVSRQQYEVFYGETVHTIAAWLDDPS